MVQRDANSQKSNAKSTGPLNGKTRPARARQENIKQLIQAKGFVSSEYLAREFGVTPQTIRRDINTLSENGIITRYHGGRYVVQH